MIGFALAPPDELKAFASNSLLFSTDKRPAFRLNITKAPELLVQAGYKNGKLPGDVKLLFVPSQRNHEFSPIVEGIRPYRRELGIELDFRI